MGPWQCRRAPLRSRGRETRRLPGEVRDPQPCAVAQRLRSDKATAAGSEAPEGNPKGTMVPLWKWRVLSADALSTPANGVAVCGKPDCCCSAFAGATYPDEPRPRITGYVARTSSLDRLTRGPVTPRARAIVGMDASANGGAVTTVPGATTPHEAATPLGTREQVDRDKQSNTAAPYPGCIRDRERSGRRPLTRHDSGEKNCLICARRRYSRGEEVVHRHVGRIKSAQGPILAGGLRGRLRRCVLVRHEGNRSPRRATDPHPSGHVSHRHRHQRRWFACLTSWD